MKNDKTEYIYNHIQTVKERMDTVKENLKWIFDDIKIIEKMSKPKQIAKN